MFVIFFFLFLFPVPLFRVAAAVAKIRLCDNNINGTTTDVAINNHRTQQAALLLLLLLLLRLLINQAGFLVGVSFETKQMPNFGLFV